MKRPMVFVGVVSTVLFASIIVGTPAQGKAPGPNGQIAFARAATPPGTGHVSYAVNPDGTKLHQIFAGHSDFPRWSPDGRQVALGDMVCQFDGTCSAVIVDPDTGISRMLPNPDPTLYSSAFCSGAWSPDGTRMACSLFGAAGVTVATIRSTDGGGLKKILSCGVFGPDAECGVADFSPDGTQVLLGGPDQDGNTQFFVANLDGSGLRQVTPSSMDVDGDSGASWSPDGNRILFTSRTNENHARSTFVVNADGTRLHRVRVRGCGNLKSDPIVITCYGAGWSPDGTEFVFVRAKANHSFFLGKPSNLTSYAVYTANADGSGLNQVTAPTNLEVTSADWGTHPLAT